MSYIRTKEIKLKQSLSTRKRFLDLAEREKCGRNGSNNHNYGKKNRNASKGLKKFWKEIRKDPERYKKMMEERSKNHKGYQTRLGVKLSEETKRKIQLSNIRTKKLKGPSYPNPVFVQELGHVVRSTLERDSFLVLKKIGVEYKYEKRIDLYIDKVWRSYYVDAWVLGTNIYIECKGWFDDYSIKKMMEFRKQNPEKKLYAITYKENKNKIPQGCCDEIFYIEEIEDLILELNAKRREEHAN